MDSTVFFEALSTVMGTTVRPHSEFVKENPGKEMHSNLSLHLHDFHRFSLLQVSLPLSLSGETEDDNVFFHDHRGNRCCVALNTETHVDDLKPHLERELSGLHGSCNIISFVNGDIVNSIQPGRGKPAKENEFSVIPKELFANENEFFDQGYSYDFTHLKDTVKFERGGEEYKRPYGWNRIALKVLGKYDGNEWLGANTIRFPATSSVPNEWPVSYHGTDIEAAKKIIPEYYKPGNRALYGYGVYSTPDVSVAETYSKQFTSKSSGKTYKVVLQNRINPAGREVHRLDGHMECGWTYFVILVKKGDDVKKVSEANIRPYGLLLKEV